MEWSLRNRIANWFGKIPGERRRRTALDSALLIEHCPEGIVHTRDGVIAYVNPALLQAFDCPATDLVGRPLTEFLPLRDRQAWLALLAQFHQGRTGGMIDGEFTVRSGNGKSRRDVIVRLCPASRRTSNEVIVFVEDVTGLRRSEGALRDHARRLRQLARQVIDVQEAERRHLARELHDEIGQQLTLLKMFLLDDRPDRLPDHSRLQQAVEQVETLTSQVRSLSLDLRPSMLDDLGLVAAVRWFVKRTAAVTGLVFDAELPESFPRLPPEAETAFFRVAQESINNIVKHAEADRVSMRLACGDSRITMEIADNGMGFDGQSLLRAAHEGFGGGLLGMQERAALVGADVDITSSPGSGCCIRMTLPFSVVTAPAQA